MIWRVVIAGEVTEDRAAAIKKAGLVHLGGHGTRGRWSSTVVARAATEDEAAAAVATAFAVPVTFVREVTSPPIWVYAPVEAEDSQRLATAIRPEDQASLIEEEAPEHRFEICFELPQMPVDQVFAEARNRYGAICERAGVALPEPLEMTAAGFEVFLEDQRRDSELLDRANDLVAQGHHDLAVIVAQTACEVLVADAMRAVARGHASDELYPWLLQRVGSYTLIDNQTRKLWNALSATSIQQEPWWSEYREHVRRRNQIVHEGQRVDVEAARASLAAARALFEYVEQTVATVGE